MDLLRLAQGDDDDDGDDAATPDELLLELMDLCALAFPAPLTQLKVSFVANEDGKRPALADLDGRSAANGVQRPDLGHKDNEVLDAINALLGDFAEATLAQGGVMILHGSIAMSDDVDGARDVVLADAAGDVVMTRRFDASELRWLFFTRALFQALARTADDEAVQQRRLDEALAGMQRFDIDMAKGVITFQGAGREAQPWGFELVGSFLEENKRFLWGWANESVDPKLTRVVDQLRQQSTAAGLRAFTDASFGGPEPLFLRLARHAAVVAGAFGLYRAPFAAENGKGVMYLSLRSI
ncbi:MAG: hypothetical protein Q8O67_30315 [Deltaproteobacteria bacterium]|nr:hypothetical protein [Deltaproteobacteria bacterium]